MANDGEQPRAYDADAEGDVLTITIRKEFDFGNLHQDWAHALTISFPGPFREVRIDMAACGLVSSTFFAGMVQLHHLYTGNGCQTLRLIKPDPRMVRNLKMLRLDKLFEIESR